jgi:hypothetical protein
MPEKRQNPRYQREVMVDFTPVDSKVTGMTRDVSLGGIFVRTSRPPFDGQNLLVTLRLADGHDLLFFGKVIRTFRATAIRSDMPPTGFALAISDSESYKRFVSSVASTVRSGAGAEGQGPDETPDLRNRRADGDELGVTIRQMTDEAQTVFAISLLKLPDGRILVTADDSKGETGPVKIAVRKESAVRERLPRRHTAEEVYATMGALSKNGDSTTFSQSWPSLDSVRRFWTG